MIYGLLIFGLQFSSFLFYFVGFIILSCFVSHFLSVFFPNFPHWSVICPCAFSHFLFPQSVRLFYSLCHFQFVPSFLYFCRFFFDSHQPVCCLFCCLSLLFLDFSFTWLKLAFCFPTRLSFCLHLCPQFWTNVTTLLCISKPNSLFMLILLSTAYRFNMSS